MQPCHIQNSDTFKARDIFRACQTCKTSRNNQSPDIVRTLFKHFQEDLGMLRDIDAYQSTLTDVQLVETGGGLPCPFLKIEKNVQL